MREGLYLERNRKNWILNSKASQYPVLIRE